MGKLACFASALILAACSGGNEKSKDAGAEGNSLDAQKDSADANTDLDAADSSRCLRDLGGSITITNDTDVAEILDVCNISGNLSIAAPGLGSIELPYLKTIGGELVGVGQDFHTLNFLGLKSASKIRISTVAQSVMFDFSSLESVSSSLEVDGAGSVALPHLINVGSDLTILQVAGFSAPQLETVGHLKLSNTTAPSVTFPALTSIDYLEMRGNLSLASIGTIPAITGEKPGLNVWISDSPGLTSISFLQDLVLARSIAVVNTGLVNLSELKPDLALECCLVVTDNAALLNVSAPGLISMFGGIQVQRNALVQSVSLPNVTTMGIGNNSGAFEIENNPDLTTVNVPLWVNTSVGSNFKIVNNPKFPTCKAEAIKEQVPAGTFTISGNDDAAVCN